MVAYRLIVTSCPAVPSKDHPSDPPELIIPDPVPPKARSPAEVDAGAAASVASVAAVASAGVGAAAVPSLRESSYAPVDHPPYPRAMMVYVPVSPSWYSIRELQHLPGSSSLKATCLLSSPGASSSNTVSRPLFAVCCSWMTTSWPVTPSKAHLSDSA